MIKRDMKPIVKVMDSAIEKLRKISNNINPYFILKEGDIIKDTDEYLGVDNKWYKVGFYGDPWNEKIHVPHRRKDVLNINITNN